MAYQLADLRGQRLARDPEHMLDNLNEELELRFSVGIWYFTPSGGRFHDRFVPEATLEERLEIAAEMAELGVTGIEAHYPAEVNEENSHLYRQLEAAAGIRLVAVPFSHFFDKRFEFGSLSTEFGVAARWMPGSSVSRRAIESFTAALLRPAAATLASSRYR